MIVRGLFGEARRQHTSAIEEGERGCLKEERQAQSVSVERDRAVEIAHIDGDLADRGQPNS